MTFVPRSLKIAIALAGMASLSACVSAPTYGTGTKATTQLVEDLGEAVLVITPQQKNLVYEARPELVRPTGDVASRPLVPPQTSVATAGSPGWVESPEEQRQRLYDEAEANKDNPNYRSPLLTGGKSENMTEKEQLAAFRQARKEATTIDISQRRYLIDPPAQYRQASSPEALNDLGADERTKERRRKQLAEGKNPDKCFLFLNCTSRAAEEMSQNQSPYATGRDN